MNGKNHMIGGAGFAAAAFGGVRYGLRHSEFFYKHAMPVLYHVNELVFPHDMHIAFKALMFAAGAGAYMLGTLLPDTDNQHSTLGRYFYIPVGHRRLMHSIWPIFLLYWLGCLNIFLRPLIFACAGYFSHLFLDGFSELGIPWLWPVKFKIKLPFYKCGDVTEKVFLYFFLAFAAFCLIAGFFL